MMTAAVAVEMVQQGAMELRVDGPETDCDFVVLVSGNEIVALLYVCRLDLLAVFCDLILQLNKQLKLKVVTAPHPISYLGACPYLSSGAHILVAEHCRCHRAEDGGGVDRTCHQPAFCRKVAGYDILAWNGPV